MQVGDVWSGQVEIRDAAGQLADAGAVTLTLTPPDGVAVVVGTARASLGTYTATFPLTMVGQWLARWVATGANASVWTDVVDVADPARAPLVSLDEIRTHMNWGVPSTPVQRARDAEGLALAGMASELVESYTGRVFRRRTVVEERPGGGPAVLLTSLPVLSVTSVTDGTTTVDPSTYRLTPAGVLYRVGGWWPSRVVATYVAGQAVPPEPVRLAVLRLVEHHWQREQQAPHPLQGGGGGYDEGQPSGDRWALPYAIASLLDGYRAPGFA